VLHYPARVRRSARLAANRAMPRSAGATADETTFARRVLNSFVPVPLGTAPTSFHELLRFRTRAWSHSFDAAGLEIVSVKPTGIFFTGHELLPHLSVTVRRRVALLVGSGSVAFVLRSRVS
jgi:hypothetical protein